MSDTFRINYTELNDKQKEAVKMIKNTAVLLLQEFNNAVPVEERSERSRCMAIARTNLEQAVMWAVKGATTKIEV